MKAFAYVNPTNEKDAVAALSPQFEQALPHRRRPGSAGADEGLRHAARPHRQREGRARVDGRRLRTAGCGSARR